jgi:lipopolysaccharide biosynthesis glycosyltransferase
MRRKSDRPVVLACDEAYQPAACVCLTSLFLNSADVEFITYLVTDAPNERLSAAMRRLADTFKRDIRIAALDSGQVRALIDSLGPLDLPAHISPATMIRLALPELLSADSFLYVDCDMVVQESVKYLLGLDLGGNIVAAAAEVARGDWGRRNLSLGASDAYVNAGLLVVDAKAWRAHGGLRRVGEIGKRYGAKLVAADQDIINVFCRSRVLVLERRWNTLQQDFMMAGGWETFDVDGFRGIFHFNSEIKPWMAWATVQSRQLYGRYAAVAPMRMAEVTAPRNVREAKVAAMAQEYERRRAIKAAPGLPAA